MDDWLRELPGELANEAVWATLAFSAAWLWKNQEKIKAKLGRTPKPVIVTVKSTKLNVEFPSPTITAASERKILWDVEAPTPPLAKRLLDEGLEVLSVLLRHL